MIAKLSILAFIISMGAFIPALRFAKRHNIVDNPNYRKLQKQPVPVFGGIVVLLGILIPTVIAIQYYAIVNVWYLIGAIIFLWGMGVVDDIRGLSPSLRVIIEMVLVCILIFHPFTHTNGPLIDNLHGLFDLYQISDFLAVPLTLVSAVGLINAINLIDGVDGYSSGYGIVSLTIFSALYYSLGNIGMCVFNSIAAAALIPFYLHNVFGRKSKMFLGDGGSLIVGFIVAFNVITLLASQSDTAQMDNEGVGIVPLLLAITSIPVFDTLRVMVARIITGRSPFSPDNGHLHHAFIALGFSHFATSSLIILMNLLIVVSLYLSYLMGASITMQFAWVTILGFSATCGVYYLFRYAESHHNRFFRLLSQMGRHSHFEKSKIWGKLEVIIDYE